MNVLAISGRQRDGAAALAIDGRVVAAAAEETFARVPAIGYRETGGFPWAAAAACLEQAGLTSGDVSVLAAVSQSTAENGLKRSVSRALRRGRYAYGTLAEGLDRTRLVHIGVMQARVAELVAAYETDPCLLFVLEPQVPGDSGVFLRRDGSLTRIARIDGFDKLSGAARRLARVLGCDVSDPFAALEEVGRGHEDGLTPGMTGVLGWTSPTQVSVDEEGLSDLLRAASNGEGPLADADSPNIHVQRRRRALAGSFCDRVGEVLCELVRRVRDEQGVDHVAIGGSFFSSARMNSRLRASLGVEIDVAPVPEPRGLALGAALTTYPAATRKPLHHLTLGPEFSEQHIKDVLDNCRLDYVYEPDWQRLLTRASALLARGKVVAWFQGPADFGPRSLAGRCILADPSNRYARDNLNWYLRGYRLESPLPVSMCDCAAAECLTQAVRSPFMLLRAKVKEEFRDRMRAALDEGAIAVHTVASAQGPMLWQLLNMHHTRTGVPGLINVPLAGPGEPMACTPRDAIRTMYASAIDALVIGRFLLMKDYWLLRSDTEP